MTSRPCSKVRCCCTSHTVHRGNWALLRRCTPACTTVGPTGTSGRRGGSPSGAHGPAPPTGGLCRPPRGQWLQSPASPGPKCRPSAPALGRRSPLPPPHRPGSSPRMLGNRGPRQTPHQCPGPAEASPPARSPGKASGRPLPASGQRQLGNGCSREDRTGPLFSFLPASSSSNGRAAHP